MQCMHQQGPDPGMLRDHPLDARRNTPRPLMRALIEQMLQTEMDRLADAPVQPVSAASRDRLRALMQQHGVTDLDANDSLPVKQAAPLAIALDLSAALLKALAGTLRLLLQAPAAVGQPALAVRQAERRAGPGTPPGGTTTAWTLAHFQPGDHSAVLRLRRADHHASLPICRVLLMSPPGLARAAGAAGGIALQVDEALALAPVQLPEDGKLTVPLPPGWAWQPQVENRSLPSDAEGMLWIVLAAQRGG